MTRRRHTARLLVLSAALLLLAGCGRWDVARPNPPGTNDRVGDLLVRYVHIAEPQGDSPHAVGSDVPMFAWLYNAGSTDDRLTDVTTPVAGDVVLAAGTGGLPTTVPAHGMLLLRPGEDQLVLRGLRRPLRGGDWVDMTLVFEHAGRLALSVQVQPPSYDPESWTPGPVPT
jgi:copper(I)-binding protein